MSKLNPSSQESLDQQSSRQRRSNYANQQAKLVLLAGLPGFFLTLIVLFISGASYYLIAFFGITLGLIIGFAAISGRQKADYQIQTLSNLIEAMIDGDYSLRGRKQSNPAFQHLLTLINQLADKLQQHKLKAEQSQQLFNMVIQQMDALVIATDEQGKIVILNDAAKKLIPNPHDLSNLDITAANTSSSDFFLSDLSLTDLSLSALTESNDDIIYINQKEYEGEYIVYRDRFISDGESHSLFLLTRAEQLLRRKEREDWQNLIRVLSHELNNSLTPITSYASTMLRKIEREQTVNNRERFIEGLSVIKSRSESLGAFIASYSQLAHLPPANPVDVNWFKLLHKLTLLFPEVSFQFNIDKSIEQQTIPVDPQQFEQLIINLFKNAQEAMAHQKQPTIEIDASLDEKYLTLKINDTGTGLTNPDNLFVPFYTTKPSGSGIGLTLCRQIMLAHSGSIRLMNRTDKSGVIATLRFPINTN